MNLVKNSCNLIIVGDFNALVGENKKIKSMVKVGLGNWNGRRERLLNFCEQYEMIVTNTCFEVPNTRKIHMRNASRQQKIPNRLYSSKKYRNQIKSRHLYPGCDINSAHVLVMAKCDIRF